MNIKNDDMVMLTDMNTMVELKKSNKTIVTKGKIKRIDKTHYVDIDTGEVKEYKSKNTKISSRKNNPESLARTGRTTKAMMICNFEDRRKTQYITLTYNEPVFDYDEAYEDFKTFIKNIRRNYCADNKIKYFVVEEEHYDSSIHFHCLIYWENDYPVEMINKLSKHWSKGDAYNKPIKENRDILYIASYLVSGCYNNGKKVKKNDIAKAKDEKAAIKNVRLENVPAYYHHIKHSKNMLKPLKEEMTYEKAFELYDFEKPFDERTFEKEFGDFKITNEYEYYEV